MDFETPYTFGEMLKVFRERSCLTQQQLAAMLGVHYNTVGGWERGNVLPKNRGIVLELVKRLHLNDQEGRLFLEASLTALAPHWRIPYRRNQFFTGREEILEALYTYLGTNRGTFIWSYAICGLGGIGKTQLAVEYAYRYGLEYTAVFWIDAESVESINADLLAMAELLQLSEWQDAEPQRLVTAIQHWLSAHSGWLLIWDNLENVELLQYYLPPAHQGAVLITTRLQAVGALAQGIELPAMTREEGMLLLLRRAKILASQVTERHVEHLVVSQPGEYSAAQEVVAALGGLPLALDQAGAYIEATKCSITSYLRLFRAFPLRLLDERDAHAAHPLSVVRTLTDVFNQLESNSPMAMEVLTVCAFLSPDGAIPEELFIEGAAHLGATFERLAADPFAFQNTLKALLACSLVQRDATTYTLTIHRLVQVVLKGRLSKTAQSAWVERVVAAITSLFPSDEKAQADYWQVCEQLLPHAFACIASGEQVGKDEVLHTTLLNLLNHVVGYLNKYARFAEAKMLFECAGYLREYVSGLEYPQVKEGNSLQGRVPVAERTVLCACGCGREIDTSKSRGEPKRFFSRACKQRFYRNASRQKRNEKRNTITKLE